MDNSLYHKLVDEQWDRIERGINDSGVDIDYEISGNIFTLDFDNGSQIVINRQEPKHEIWLASKTGGYHFVYKNEQWVCTKSGIEFSELLKRECSIHAEEEVSW